MRSHPTKTERALWWRLRDRGLGDLKFRRQRPEGRYIADFVCLEANLIVEIDGVQHRESVGDRQRTADLKRIGFDVIRFSNDEVQRDLDAVCDRILRAARSVTEAPPPTFSQAWETAPAQRADEG